MDKRLVAPSSGPSCVRHLYARHVLGRWAGSNVHLIVKGGAGQIGGCLVLPQAVAPLASVTPAALIFEMEGSGI
jgi:hypothetical protein